MQYRISSEEFAEWMAYYNLEPFGAEVVDFHGAAMLSLTANVNRKKGARATKPREFMLWQRDPETSETPTQIFQTLKSHLVGGNHG